MFTDYGRQKLMDQFLLFLNSSVTATALHLYTNNRQPTPFDLHADYTELVAASMPGYSSVTSTSGWVDGRDPPSQNWYCYQPTLFTVKCTATAAGMPQTVYGYYIDTGGVTNLISAVPFTNPFTFTNVNDLLEVTAEAAILPNGAT